MGPYIIPVFIPHQGCPQKCIYCDQHAITGQNAITPDQVTSLIEKGLSRKVKSSRERTEIAFYGGTFTGLNRQFQQEILSAAEAFCRAGRVQSIRLSTRPDYIDSDALDLLQAYGVDTVELGAQSMADEVLKAACRGHTRQDTLASLDLLKRKGFRTGVQLMIGLPGEDREMLFEGMRLLLEKHPDFLRIYPTLVIRKTKLAEMFNGDSYRPLDLQQAVELCADLLYLCRRGGIPVIRVGLQADESLLKNIVAGPYHPAFGELVKAEVFKRDLITALNSFNNARTVHLYISRSAVSLLTGFKKKVLKEITELTGIKEIKIKIDKELVGGEFSVH